MRRADRLFQIVLLLGRGRVVTARRMAEELEVSERTVYRDITDLMAVGTPIDGEAGVGYRLRPGYQVPPLMFDGEELEALALGAGMVRAWADTDLARAAGRVLAKVDAVLPDRLRGRWDKETLLAPDFFISPATVTGMPLRKAIDQPPGTWPERDGARLPGAVWPLGLVFWGTGGPMVRGAIAGVPRLPSRPHPVAGTAAIAVPDITGRLPGLIARERRIVDLSIPFYRHARSPPRRHVFDLFLLISPGLKSAAWAQMSRW
jgi:biotin operon repressor